MENLHPKMGIIGAGNVGVRYAYGLMISATARSLVIVDRNRKRAEGEVMDLSHGMPFVSPVQIVAGDFADLAGCDLTVITAGRKQQPGQTRLDLAKDNVEMFKEIIPLIVKYAPEAVLLVVSNPVDVLAYAAHKISGKPWQKVISSGTVLDSNRLRFLLSQHCHIDARNVHAYVLGEHGDSEFPVWSKAMFGGMLLSEYCSLCEKCDNKKSLDGLFQEVKNSAYRIIERKDETSYGIGLALVRISEAILKDENAILPVSCLVNGYYGIDDVYMSVPAVLNKTGVREVLRLNLNDEEKEDFKRSAQTLKDIIKGLKL